MRAGPGGPAEHADQAGTTLCQFEPWSPFTRPQDSCRATVADLAVRDRPSSVLNLPSVVPSDSTSRVSRSGESSIRISADSRDENPQGGHTPAARYASWLHWTIYDNILHVESPLWAVFRQIGDAVAECILAASKAQDPHRKTHRNHMSTARQVLTWLREKHPALTSLDEEGCRKRYAELRSKYSEWTACHHMTKMRHLPWHAFIQFIRYFTSIATILPAWVSKAPSITLLCSRHTRVRSRSSFCCQRVSNTRSS